MFRKVLLFVVSTALVLQLVIGQCSVNIRQDIPVRDPVYMTADAQLWAPDGPALQWAAGEQSLLVCSGSGNEIMLEGVASGSRFATITCQSGTQFLVNGISYNTIDIACRNTITGDTLNTGQSCSGGGTLLHLGFTGPNGMVPYIFSCYNMQTGSLVWTRHILPGKAVPFAVIESSRPAFKSTGSAPHVNPAVSYTQASQLTRLTLILGSQTQAERFLFSNSFMARGHMSPDADGTYRSWQFCTYWFTNVVPQWQVINAGNWVRVENAARTIATRLAEDVVIINGLYGIMTLPHIDGHDVQVTLEAGGNIEAPRWYYKVIKSPATNAAIVLVTFNNPFVTSIDESDYPCVDICAQTGWHNDFYSDYSRGRTICCTVSDLKRRVPSVPEEASAANILYWIP